MEGLLLLFTNALFIFFPECWELCGMRSNSSFSPWHHTQARRLSRTSFCISTPETGGT